MDKLSSEKVQQILEVVPGALRSLAQERDHWKKEAQAYRRHEEAEKVARSMHEKGINTDTSIDALTDTLEKAAAAGKLERISDAVEMIGPDMGQKIAHLTGDDSTQASGGSSNEFTRFLMGGVG